MNKKRSNAGFSLLEILIAIIVISFSAIGVAILQIKAQQFNHSAYLNTRVTLLARDMSERMRANPAGLEAGHYHLPEATQHDSCYTLSGCEASEMAENDMYEWAGDHENSSIKLLAQGSAVVCIDSTPDDGSETDAACDNIGKTYAIKVWRLNLEKSIARTVITSTFNY